MIQVKFKRLTPEAQVPKKANPSDSGFDLTAIGDPVVGPEGYLQYHTGIAIELPEGYEGQIRPRSSISKYDLVLANGGPGSIDNSYRGELIIRYKLVNRFNYINSCLVGELITRDPIIYHKGDRIAQLVVVPIPEVELIEVNTLSSTIRGTGSFGSTDIINKTRSI